MFKALYPRTIWLMFLSFAAIILSVGLFRYWMPNQEEAGYKVTQANSLFQEANKLSQAVKKRNKAVEELHLAEAAWLPIMQTRTPLQSTPDGGINLNVNAYQLLLDTKRYRNNIQRAVNAQLLKGGVKVIAGPRVPGVTDVDAPNGVLASYYNYPAIPFPVVIFDLGQVQIQGTYEQIMANVRAWANMPRYLAVTHNLQLTGTAPQLNATYDVSLVGYIRYDGVFAPVPDGGGAAAGGGAANGRGPGGPGPGAPGMPGRGGAPSGGF